MAPRAELIRAEYGKADHFPERGVMKRSVLFFVFFFSFSLSPLLLHAEDRGGAPALSGIGQEPAFAPMPGPGKKVSIGSGYSIMYGFDKKPKLGTVIMKVEVYKSDGKRDTSLELKADAGMPSMKGAHETGDRPFSLSKKGDYLLPIGIVMPGDWEIRLTIIKDGRVIFRGRYNFDV